ncbi:MerR family transcriptional regulator [Flavonifractor plautii]|nr:MerR family transcriptional regulator [Flavonifractor plautii]
MSPIKENLLSITELAKLRQVTSETLRYYDRIGLITPDYVDPQTRYRYYSIRQYEKLGTIKELRQLGMSIHDITDYFSGRNLRKSHQLLLHQLELLEEEIRKQQLLSEILRRKLHFLSEITPPPPVDKVFCRAFPQRYMITFGEPAAAPGSTPLPSPGWSATWTRWPPSWPATVSASMQTGTCWSPATIIFPPSP